MKRPVPRTPREAVFGCYSSWDGDNSGCLRGSDPRFGNEESSVFVRGRGEAWAGVCVDVSFENEEISDHCGRSRLAGSMISDSKVDIFPQLLSMS